MEPPIPIGSMYSIFTYTQVTFFNGRSSQIYQSHQLSGLFFDPTCFITPHGGKTTFTTDSFNLRRSHKVALAAWYLTAFKPWSPAAEMDDSKHPFRPSNVEREGWGSFGAWLVGGWTNPFEKYAREVGNLPQGSGWKWNIFELPPPSWGFLKVELYFHPWSFTLQNELSQLRF